MFVATADTDSAVMSVMTLESPTMASAGRSPVLPTIQPVRRYMITPRMVSIEGVKTPRKVPSFCALG